MELNPVAIRIAVKIIKPSEGFNAIAYPDPSSPLYKALSAHGMLQRYMRGDIKWKDLAENFQALSGTPWTVGFGETQGVTKDTVWTLAEAESRLTKRVEGFMQQVLQASPKLATQSPEKIAAVTSLVYNIGMGDEARKIDGYLTSTVRRKIAAEDWAGAAASFSMWNKSRGLVVAGLVTRRATEAALFMSARG